MRPRAGLLLPAAIGLALLCGRPLHGRQDTKPRDKDKEKPAAPVSDKTVIRAAHALSWEEGPLTVTFLTGGVTVERPENTLQAARVMMWKKSGSDRSFDELYAEGNVIFTRGPQRLNCQRFYFNNVEEKGAVVDVRLKGFSNELKIDFFAMAAQARLNGAKGEMVADNVSMSTCSYGVPHYHLTVDHAVLLGEHANQTLAHDQKKILNPFGDEWEFDFDELVPEFSGVPFLFIPGLSVGPWLMNFPIRSVRVGHSSRFGNLVYADFGSRIRLRDEKGKLKQWGDIDLRVDWRQARGWAGGPEVTYKWDDYQGYLDTYYLHDLGRRPGSEFDAQLPPLEHPDRSKIHWFHRQDLDEHWRYELEAYYLSDRSLLQEFFPHEFQQEKEPETAAYVRWMDGNMGAYLLGRYRMNDFQTQDEYLPRADFNLLAQPIFGGLIDNLYLTERIDAVDIRRKYDEDLGLPSVDTWRADAITQLFMAFDFRYFQVSPFLQNRATIYEEDLSGDPRQRDLWTAGTRLTTQIHATHPEFLWERVGIRGLRHVAELEIRYANSFANNVNPSDLFPFEPVDQLGRFEEVAFELRQRFLTKDPSNKAFEFLTVSLGLEYYPESGRDTGFANANNAAPPFNWIPAVENAGSATFPGRLWSNVYYDIELRPRNFFSLTMAGEYNPLAHSEEVREIGATFTPFEGLTGSIKQEMVKGVTNAFTLGVTWAMTPKWAASVFGQYDFKTNQYLRQDLVISRDFHDFSIEAVIERDFTRDENRFFVAFVPKFLGKAGAHKSHLYRPEGPRVEAPTDR